MTEIVLITRLRTLNKGNQALSAAWLAMAQRAYPTAAVRVLERRPRHLLQYTLREVARARDPVAAFDALAAKLARGVRRDLALPPAPPARILLDEAIAPPQRFVAVRQRLNLRGRLARVGWYADEYARRLAACARARAVVVNPAGEFFPREPQAAFYHLLDAHVAAHLGVPTAMVNHTMDITDRTLRAIIPHVYRGLALVGFRDEKSVAAFRAMGGDPSNVLVTPDLALATELGAVGAPRPRSVAVAINVPEATAGGYLDAWERVIGELRATGAAVTLVSNELPADRPFYERLIARYPGLPIAGAGLDHTRYGELLGTFEAVVSSRMHTLVLAMIGGAPVVPVEGSSFKITALYRELQLPHAVVAPAELGTIAARVADASARRGELAAQQSAAIATARERIVSVLVPRLRALGEGAVS